MDRETFQKKLDAIEGMTLDRVEYHDRLIALIIEFCKERPYTPDQIPCTADSVTSSPDSTSPISDHTYSTLPSGASVSEC